MNPPSNDTPELPIDAQSVATPVTPATRPLYWSIRRELWESRSIYIAPMIIAAVLLFSFLVSSFRLPERIRSLPSLEPARQRAVVVKPYSVAASIIIMTGLIVGVFYCLDALNGERRDRSILFWKSLPVSDRTAVLSKASIPLVVIPLVTLAIALSTQLIMLLLSSAVLAGNGINPVNLWARLPLFQMWLVMLYGLTVHALWFSPIYGWLLLVSAWARRATFLWAALPFFAIGVVAKMAFGSAIVTSMLKYRVMGAMAEAFAADPGKVGITQLSQLDPLKFLSSPGLWIGLVFATACLAAAIRLRRNREPI